MLSLRTRFVLIVVLGAIIPLAVVGVWLNSGVARAGRTLLADQLQASLDNIFSPVEERWEQREGDIQLLANNVVATTALIQEAPLSSPDSQYLARLVDDLKPSIDQIRYVDVRGRVRWASVEAATLSPTAGARADDGTLRGTFDIVEPIVADGVRIGTLHARVSVASIFGSQVSVAIPGAIATISDSTRALSTFAAALRSSGESVGTEWSRVQRSLDGLPITLSIAAPQDVFVEPFARVARNGWGVLMLVAVIALCIALALTSQLTRSLSELAIAADRVAAGDLDGPLARSGRDEVGRLGHAYNQMTANLRGVLRDLSQQRALAAVGEFASMLSHEVRNGLTAVRVDLQHAHLHTDAAAPVTRLLERALGNVERLNGTVTGALQIARSGTVSASPVALREVLHRALHAASAAIDATPGAVASFDASVDVLVAGDAVALEQMFVNVMLNAAQSLTVGGTIRVSLRATENVAQVVIVDTGCGMTAESLQHVGQPFRSSKARGTGLGLPIAMRIAEAHRGTLGIVSEEGVGTTVTIGLRRSE